MRAKDQWTGSKDQQSVAAGIGSSEKLGEEERACIRRALGQAGIEPTKQIVERLMISIAGSMAMFRQDSARGTYRERHDALRDLLRLVEATDPPMGVIRKRIGELSLFDIDEMTERAHRLWSRVFPGECLKSDFDLIRWAQTAPAERLLEVVRTFATDGGKRVRGRVRPGGKRSKSHFEPLILGHARGAAAPTRAEPELPGGASETQPWLRGNGRPRAQAAHAPRIRLASGHRPRRAARPQ
jgi:hypothetical protein